MFNDFQYETSLSISCSNVIGIPPIAGCNASGTDNFSFLIHVVTSIPTLVFDNSFNSLEWIKEASSRNPIKILLTTCLNNV